MAFATRRQISDPQSSARNSRTVSLASTALDIAERRLLASSSVEDAALLFVYQRIQPYKIEILTEFFFQTRVFEADITFVTIFTNITRYQTLADCSIDAKTTSSCIPACGLVASIAATNHTNKGYNIFCQASMVDVITFCNCSPTCVTFVARS